MPAHLLGQIQRAARMPPRVLARRLRLEAGRCWDRWFGAETDLAALLSSTKAASLDELWESIGLRPYATAFPAAAEIHATSPASRQRILDSADQALRRRVDLMGSGEIDLGERIDWHCDYISGLSWPLRFASDLNYRDPDQPNDVKFPWELSRLQWLIPVGQAYLLTGDEKYASCVRRTLEDWIKNNPYLLGVNWACPMEAAMRIFTWTWFFHAFHRSSSWSSGDFRGLFLRNLFSHGRYLERYLEYSDVNGNHCTADAAGLVFAGSFFGPGRTANRWHDAGWSLLARELPRQVTKDGVNFEGSVPYHRLVAELFFFAARYRQRLGQEVPQSYLDRLRGMARFTAAYTRPDGLAPVWGDTDDARVLPFGGQPINDHRYLAAIIDAAWNDAPASGPHAEPLDEVLWSLGTEACRKIEGSSLSGDEISPIKSSGFEQGGYFIMRNSVDYVFIDCGPVGTAGRGGHGHNDCLSFEAALCGQPLFVDCGSYVYTRCFQQRDEFRSTAYHNTPMVDGQEINRFFSPRNIWRLHDDARPTAWRWETGDRQDVFQGAHSGYQRLAEAVLPIRTITLDHRDHVLQVQDDFDGAGRHDVRIPLHLAVGVTADVIADGRLLLRSHTGDFLLQWGSSEFWNLEITSARVSPSYGVVQASQRLCFYRSGELQSLVVRISPVAVRCADETKTL